MSWGYGLRNGPQTWNYSYPIAESPRQSPIDIDDSRSLYDVRLSHNLLHFKYEFEREIQIVNTGHSIEARVSNNSVVRGGPLQHTYRLVQFHLHWGSEERGSEHTIDGKQYAAELHLVHYNCDKYRSFSSAMSKPDGLCVVAVMIQTGGEHTGFRTISQHLKKLTQPGSKCNISTCFSPYYLLPENTRSFWAYKGSLTTPPLYESVTWIVFQDPIALSDEQFSQLRQLRDSDGGPMQNNFRPPRDLGGRKVRKTFI